MAIQAASSSEDEDLSYVHDPRKKIAAAYNQSIYIMLCVPFLLLGFFGFKIYRGMKLNEQYREAQRHLERATPNEGAENVLSPDST